ALLKSLAFSKWDHFKKANDFKGGSIYVGDYVLDNGIFMSQARKRQASADLTIRIGDRALAIPGSLVQEFRASPQGRAFRAFFDEYAQWARGRVDASTGPSLESALRAARLRRQSAKGHEQPYS